MKKLVALLALVLCMSVVVVSLSGCAKKKAEQPAVEAAPADSTAAVDTTAAAQ